MKKKRNKLISILLTLVMTLSLVPAMGVTASAADSFTEVRTYGELKAAVDRGSAKIKLTADINSSNFVEGVGVTPATNLKFKGSGNVLDLNDHKLTLASNMGANFIELRDADLTIKDSGTNGRIDIEYRSVVGVQQAILIDNTGSLTVDGGTLSSSYRGIILIDSAGSITINGGRLYAPVTNSGSSDYVILSTHSYKYNDTLQLHVNGGEIDGRVVLKRDDSSATGTLKYKVTPIKITGGTFKQGLYATWGMGNNPEGAPKNAEMTMESPTVEITGGVFEKNNDDDQRESRCYIDLATKLRGGTFKDPSTTIRFVGGEYTWDATQPQYRASIGNSAILYGNDIRTAYGWSESEWFKIQSPCIYLHPKGENSVTVIPNAWGMKSVTLDGNKIDYFKDWKGTVERMDNSTAHTLKFEWYPLASELVNAGYTYRTTCEHYISGSTAVQQTDTIAADKTSHTITIPANADPKVYSYDLQLNLDKNGSSVGIFGNQHIVKLVVSEAPPEPPAPVAHSITIINGFGTAEPETAMPGETVTVTADDRTADNMMFTQWYTKTAGVTFADATKRKTTFVMPDCDVKVNPGYHGVSFTNQPTDSWLSSVDDSKVYFAFSQPITSWKLVNEDDTTLASGDAESANALVAATLGPKPNKTEMTCRVIVTSNGQNFTSNEFTLKWYNVPGAQDVMVYPEGGKFVETLDVNLKTPNTYWGILYTTDGSDPYDKSGETWTKNPSAIEENESTRVTINKDTTIKACLYNSEGYSNMEKFGDIVTCDFTKVELKPPVADPPSGTSFYDRLNVSLSTDIVNAKIMWSYDDCGVDDLSTPGKWKEYEPEKESITLSGGYGTHGFYALTGIRMEHPDGYTYWVHSDKQDYSYPRISYATIADASVTGKVNEEITPVDVSITLSGDVFAEDLTAGTDVSGWFTNLPIGLKATVKEKTNYTKTLVVTISGMTTETSTAAISVKMPKSALRYTGTSDAVEQTVLSNPKAVYNIGASEVHTTHTLTVNEGTGSGDYAENVIVTIQANETATGKQFKEWTGLDSVEFVDGTSKTSATAKFKMPAEAVTATATYEDVVIPVEKIAAIPTAKTGLIYDGNEKTGVEAGEGYTLSGTVKATDAGDYTATAALETDYKWNDGTTDDKIISWSIDRAAQEAPSGLAGVAPTASGGSDGKITGTTADMEYSTDAAFASKFDCTDTETTGLEAGTYYVRYKEKTNYYVGTAATVTVGEGTPVATYTLTVNEGTGSGDYAENVIVTIQANEAATGKQFKEWTGLDSVEFVDSTSKTSATAKFKMPAEAVTATATYEDVVTPPSHTHTYDGTWKFDENKHWKECADTSCDNLTGSVKEEAPHSFAEVVTPATPTTDGKKESKCSVCGYVGKTETINATGYKITFDAKGGTLTATELYTDRTGKLASLPNATRSGYTFDGWFTAETGGEKVTTEKTFNANITLYAHWTAKSGGSSGGGGGGGSATKYAVTVSSTDNGKVTSDKTSVARGNLVTITAKANDGYVLDTIKVTDKDGKEIKLTDKSNGKYTFAMPASKVEVKAVFKQTESKPDKPAEEIKTVVVMQVGSKTMFVNGKSYEKDAAPVIMNDRTLVPIRFVTESLGGEVKWNAETKEVTLVIDGKEIKMTIGKNLKKYGVAPVIISDRTFVPVRFVADELGAETEWDDTTKTVTITKTVTEK